MKRKVLFLGLFLCFWGCNVSNSKQKIAFDTSFDNERYSLDCAIEESQKENKPIVLWVSYNGNSTDNVLKSHLRNINSVGTYLIDSMVFCRILVNNKILVRKIINAQMLSLLPDSLNFKDEGKLNEWVCNTYFDGYKWMFVITDSQLRKLSPYKGNGDFDHDSISFLNFMKEGKARYRELHSGTKK